MKKQQHLQPKLVPGQTKPAKNQANFAEAESTPKSPETLSSPTMQQQQHQSATSARMPGPAPQAAHNQSVFRVPPYHYLHVLDQTTNVTRVEIGPMTFIRKDNEIVVSGPCNMIVVPPQHYCIIKNPVCRDTEGKPVFDHLNQVKLQHAESEVRLASLEPFPLYPGEEVQEVLPLKVVPAMEALKLKVLRDFEDDGGKVQRKAGDEFLFEGPNTYVPRKEVQVASTVKATVVHVNEALKIRAERNTIDREGVARVAGEEYLIRKVGAYLPGVYESVVEKRAAHVLTEKEAILVKAKKTFKDQLGTQRKTGEEYLITMDDMESFIPDVYEEVVSKVPITVLTNLQFCVVLNPVGPDGKPRLGHRKLVRGEKSFFLQPGEELERGQIQDTYVLEEDEGIVLKCIEEHDDLDDGVLHGGQPHDQGGQQQQRSKKRKPGDTWMLRGPREYIPTVEVEVAGIRKAITLHENEGVYVRNIKTGAVRSVVGKSYLLQENEELWCKQLPDMVRNLLNKDWDVRADRGKFSGSTEAPSSCRFATGSRGDKDRDGGDDSSGFPHTVPSEARVVTFQVPNNAAVQIYDYASKRARVEFGPDLVMLGPSEEFTQLSLSGGKPKKPNVIRAIALLLGPDFCSDLITVETSDHARLQLLLAYNWHFDVASLRKDRGEQQSGDEITRLFCVQDFVGDMCKVIASKIRGAVSSVSFDDFHKNSARIITAAVFPEAAKELRFSANALVVTSIDIQSVEPVDQRTRDSLQKSVTLAIEITTRSQEAAAKREAERVDQEAKGRLERQRIMDDAEAEKARTQLLTLQAQSAAVEVTGQAKAEAQSVAEAKRIEASAAVEAAKLKAEAAMIEANSELERLTKAREAELSYLRETNALEVKKAEEMAKVEVDKFKQMVDALGQDTIVAISSAPAEHQVKMLQSLGISSALITDGKTPINLLNTAKGFLGINQ